MRSVHVFKSLRGGVCLQEAKNPQVLFPLELRTHRGWFLVQATLLAPSVFFKTDEGPPGVVPSHQVNNHLTASSQSDLTTVLSWVQALSNT